MVNVSGSRSAVADAQRDMPRETQLDEEKIGMEEDVRIEAKHDYSPIEAEATSGFHLPPAPVGIMGP